MRPSLSVPLPPSCLLTPALVFPIDGWNGRPADFDFGAENLRLLDIVQGY